MTKKYILFSLFIIFNWTLFAQQITTNTSSTLQELINNNLAQGCVEISNISSSVNGSVNNLDSYGYFEKGSSNFPFQNGIILSTGNINSAGNTLNTSPLHEGEKDWLTDSDLETALGITSTLNATSIEFDFVSVTNQIQFNYLLASEEYSGTEPCKYADGFAFLIKKVGESTYNNIALIPGTSVAVSIQTIHPNIPGNCTAVNEQYFEGYNLGDTNYNGRTTVLTATAAIQPYEKYHIKLVIADQTDENYDSAVFIEGNSFNAAVDLGPDITTCGQTVNLNADIQNSLATYEWFLNDTLISGENGSTLITTESGTYRVKIDISINSKTCLIEDEVIINLNSEQSAGSIPDFLLCDDSSNDGVEFFDLSFHDYYVIISVPPSNYNISYHLSEADAQSNTNPITSPIQNSSNPQPIYVRIKDTNSGCLAFSSFNLIVNAAPIINDPTPIDVCDDDVDRNGDGITTIDLNPTTSEITNGNTNLYVSYHYSQLDAENGINAIFSPYTNINPIDTLYIRVYDATTGCVTIKPVTITVHINPKINFENQWISFCGSEENGFRDFDLTSAIDNILNGLTDVSVTYHEAYNDVLTGNNPIDNPTTYENIHENFQVIYVRVVDDATGCFSISHLELHVNVVSTGFIIEDFYACDDASNDGIAQFDLNEVTDQIVQGHDDFIFTFYESEDDLANNINPLDNDVLYTVDSSKTIYASIEGENCSLTIIVPLVVRPTVDIPSNYIVEYCDENNDGYTSIFMETFNTIVGQGVNPVNIKYYLTEEDAQNNENILAPYFNNFSNPQIAYARVTNPQTKCYDITTIEINIIVPPIVYSPPSIAVCDDDNDGINTVNLEDTIIQTVPDTNGFSFSFYTDYNDALSKSNAISNPDNYTTETQLIYTRVENDSTGCYSVTSFYVFINTVPEFITITTFENCEANANGSADFYFYEKDVEILNGQDGKDVLYFETEQDALDRTNSIYKYDSYQNTSNPQTIYTRVENNSGTDCFGVSSFELEIGSLPPFNSPESFFICDDISNDGIESIDLQEKMDEIEAGITEDLDITFHPSLYDANNASNVLPLDYSNVANPQQFYVRIENGTYCHAITSFEMIVIQVPNVSTPNPLVECDADYDDITIFDLKISELEILDVRADNIVVSYHENIDTDTNPITDPSNYTNLTNPQTVYVKVNNTISNCYVVLPLELKVNTPPIINDFQKVEICHNITNSFDLNEINSVIRDDAADIIFTYHTTYNDAQNNLNPLSTDYTYSSTSDTIYARVQFASTGCFISYPFQLIVNPLPIANVPSTFLVCDDVSNDGIELIDLTLQNNAILGTQNSNDFTISYHPDETSANDKSTFLVDTDTATNGQTIYVRIENNSTGCYSITQFDVLIYEFPNLAQPVIKCDVDYDGISTFDLTQAEADLYDVTPSYITISYFESESDLDTDLNMINNPTNYNNGTNPQTIFIKAYNTLAACYSMIELDLIINIPPVINDFSTFEICHNDTNSFDLNEITTVIRDDATDIIFTYHTTYNDAQNNLNPLSTDYTYTSTSDTIYGRVQFASTGCFISHAFQLIVNPLPSANQPSDLAACDDDFDGYLEFNIENQTSTVLGFQNPNDFSVSYHTSFDDANNNVNNLDANYNATDDETIYTRVENNNTGCYRLTQFSIFVDPLPIIPIEDIVTLCLNDLPLTVSAETNHVGDIYLWSTNVATSEIYVDEGEYGDYWVTVTTPFGCTYTKEFSIIESEQATIDFTTTVDFADPNSITIDVNGIGNYVYILDNQFPQDSNVFTDVLLGPHIVTVRDLNGCMDVSQEVIVIDAPKFFTPNNDGYNDTWHIIGIEEIVGTNVYIFDRFGKVLKSLSHTSEGWDGTYIGQDMPSTDYWFLAEVRKDSISFDVRGHFSLIRR